MNTCLGRGVHPTRSPFNTYFEPLIKSRLLFEYLILMYLIFINNTLYNVIYWTDHLLLASNGALVKARSTNGVESQVQQ